MRVANDFVVCEVVDDSSDKPYVIEQTVGDPNARMRVVGVGPEVTACEVGDKVIPRGQQFQAFKLKDKSYIVLQNAEIIAVLENAD